ncbi:urease accessory protein UreE [Leptolyngbya sp. CCY15150]|uniref:urease accessory protein UreE n=1 Tax=Leptolyngbya sp. CCY15150 TaxID=2767772 RepID=UPI0019506D05|nr:urease accessory protein UreE [Leptolyngbya sp. CCY15150]
MTIIAQHYLGNMLHDPVLQQQVALAHAEGCCIEVELTEDDCRKSRITVESAGRQVGIIKDRGWSLREGDLFKTEKGRLLLIHVQIPDVMILRFTQDTTDYAQQLVLLGYTLGNHHWPMSIVDQTIYVQLVVDRSVIETTLQHLHIPGLVIDYGVRSLDHPLPSSPHSHP